MNKKILIIGGVAGGATALTRLRRLDENAEIILFERGEYVSFANCGLPYHIGGSIEKRESLVIQPKEVIESKFNVDIRINSEVLHILKDEKKIQVKDKIKDVIYEETYDYLIISTGSTPLKPPIPGIDSPNIFSLWTIPDTDKIISFIDEKKPKRATVIGGGFIGIEMAENLHELGLEVSIVEMLDQVMTPLDFEMAQVVHQHLKSKEVNLHLGDGVKSFEYNDGITTVTLQSGKQVDSDLVILSIGVRPNGELAKDAGLTQNQRGGIIVDKYLKTSDEFIYAIGDVIEVEDYINKIPTMIPLGGPANKQGRIVANNISGEITEYTGTQGTSIVKVFDLDVATTGVNEKTLNKLGKEYKKDYLISIVHVNAHAEYYPGALPITIKLIYDLSGKVLGSQIVGYDGVDKRIDVIATAIRFNGSVDDLMELELAYAPPYSSAKDPVNMVAFAADNQLKGKTELILWNELEGLDPEKTTFLDVRMPVERLVGGIESSIIVPLEELRNRLGELDKDKLIVTYCSIGLRGYVADRILRQNGFNSVNLAGGYNTYKTMFLNDELDYEGPKAFSDSGVAINENTFVESRESKSDLNRVSEIVELNACGLSCPGPIIKVNEKMKDLKEGDQLRVLVTDPGFVSDAKAWSKNTDNTFISHSKEGKTIVAILEKGLKGKEKPPIISENKKDEKTIVVFSGDLDKAIAAFIIANGATSMNSKVNMFFTFWGLNVLRKENSVDVKKDFISNMFSKMMPRGSKKLGISKMNMGGLGSKMIRKVMKDKNISSLEELILLARNSGVKFIACQMSMDVMGITKEELIDGIEIGGVATMLSDANESNVNLFI